MANPSPLERFLSKVVVADDGCWIWHGTYFNTGYGAFWWERKQWRAHRAGYTLLRAAIPDGMTLDHLCREKRCVNPGHMEVVTAAENLRRAQDRPACRKGHAYTPDNVFRRPDGRRLCKKCRTATSYRAWLRRRARKLAA